jgi:3-phytase
VAVAAVAVAACAPPDRPADPAGNRDDTAAAGVAVIEETFVTPLDTLDNVDSPALYHHGETDWLLATAKTSNVVIVYDAGTGAVVRRIGQGGAEAGRLHRPNGIAVIDSIAFVVERDNGRVQAFALPGFRPLGTFGESTLRKPYGVTGYRDGSARWTVYVTDNYETPDEQVPPDRELAQRVKQYDVHLDRGRLRARLVRMFGDTTPPGALHIVESILADRPLGWLLIAEETVTDSHVKLYDLEGRFMGRVFGRGFFPQQAEGLALYACADGAGYLIATDQGDTTNTFQVFDRRTLDHVGTFTGLRARRTDGVALTQRPFGPFPAGAFYASHIDGAVAAFSWERIAARLGLRSDCRTP